MKKKHRICLFTLFCLVSVSPLFAYRTYGADSDEVRELRWLYTLAGRAFNVSAFPLSGERLEALTAALIKDEATGGEIRIKAGEFLDSLERPREDETVIGVALEGALEANIHGDFVWDEARGFYDRFVLFPDMLKIKAFAERDRHPGLQLSLGIKREYPEGDYEVPWNNLFLSSPGDPLRIENYFMRSGFFAWQNDVFEIRLGRSPAHYGDSRFSTFLPGKRLPYLDSLEYRYRIGPVEMISFFGMLDNRLTEKEKKYLETTGHNIYKSNEKIYLGNDGWFYSSGAGWNPADPSDNGSTKLSLGSGKTIVLNTLHRFVWQTRRLSVGMSAYMLVARENNAFTIADIFPVFSWHSSEVGNNNMSLLLDAQWSFYPGFSLYAQVGWDDINVGDLFGVPDSDIPTIGAYLLGMAFESSLFAKPLSLTLEGGTTHYLWGNYYAYSSNIKQGNYFARAIYRYKAQKASHVMPLTSPYGPGATWVDLRMALGQGRGFSGEVYLSYLNRLSGASLVSTEYKRDSLEDKSRIHSWASDFKLTYTLPYGKKWAASFYAALGLYVYDGSFWPEFRLGGRINARYLFPVKSPD